MGKTSPLTGTGKKAQKKLYKAQGTLAEMSVAQKKHDEKSRKSALYDLRQIGKGEGLPGYEKTKYDKAKYEKQTLHGLVKDFARAGKGAEKIFEPIKQEALANFEQQTTPEIANQYGRESGSGSSALNQAMAAAKVNLQRGLASDFAGLQANLAGNLLGQREQSRQFGSQFQAGQNQFGAQFKAGQNQFATQSQLANLNARMQANAGVMGQPINPVFGGLQPSYNQKQGGTSGMGGALIGGGLGALGSFAGSEAGAAAIAGLFASSKEIKENIREYDKGLEVVRELEVKNYDYIIPTEGRQQNRVGLIAEDVPEELQGMIGDIKAVDVYGLVSLLVNCVKQLDEKVKILEAA